MAGSESSAQAAAGTVETQTGWGLLDDGDFAGADAFFTPLLKDADDDVKAEACYALGKIAEKKQQVIKAVKFYIDALTYNRGYAEVFRDLGNIYAMNLKQGREALECYAQAVAYAPDSVDHRQRLISYSSGMIFKNADDNFKGILTLCLEKGEIDMSSFGDAWLSVLEHDKGFAPIWKLSSHQRYDVFKKKFASLLSHRALLDPYFLFGLGQFLVMGDRFERLMKYLRHYLLDLHQEGQYLFEDMEENEYIICALSRYIEYTDYVISESAEEKEHIDALFKKIEGNDRPVLYDLSMLGCYRALYTLKNAKAIAGNIGDIPDHVSQIPRRQIVDYFAQQDIKKEIKALTPIEDTVSVAVQEQYEEFPYPRWSGIFAGLFQHKFEGRLADKKVKILVAGCGTGREALNIAASFPEADVLAVDLSRSSLAYAIMRQRELGVENITFYHGDIMKLGDYLKPEYDFIASSGVLHHMDDPKAGWTVLYDLLKPSGLMRIALYSRTARRDVIEARNVVEREKIASDSESIKAFRDHIQDYLKPQNQNFFQRSVDYRSLPMVRDLIFHVQEHQFDLPQIKAILDEFGLKFLGFNLNGRVIEDYKKFAKSDPDATNLDLWAKYEERNPTTFKGMYAFWCEKS